MKLKNKCINVNYGHKGTFIVFVQTKKQIVPMETICCIL